MLNEFTSEVLTLPPDHFKKRAKHQYSSIPYAIIREVLQNSRDAGAKNVYFKFEDGGWSATDDGCGMDLNGFRSFFLTLGGTKKETNSIGGFGAAKELLAFFANKWAITSHDFLCEGEGAANIRSSKLPFYNPQAGFTIGAQDPFFKKNEMAAALRNVMRRSNLDLKVWLDGEEVTQGRKLKWNQLLWDFGFARLYYSKQVADYESKGYEMIRTKGLWTAHEWVGGDFVYYLEIDNPLEIMSESRDTIRPEYKEIIKRELDTVIKKGIDRKPEVKNITLYGLPKYRSMAPKQAPAPVALNSNGAVVRNAQTAEYVSTDYTESVWNVEDDGEMVQIDAPLVPLESPQDPVQLLDNLALADVAGVTTDAMGNLKFEHKAVSLWSFPFAVIEDGARVSVTDKGGHLLAKYDKALRIGLTVMKMLSTDLSIKIPIPALLFSEDAEGVLAETGPYEILGFRPEIILGQGEAGSPFSVLELFIHEFAHHYEDGHGQRYELGRMEIVRKIGKRVHEYLQVISTLQAMK